MTQVDVLVVGGGLAGLAAGAVARAGGASAVVLEAHGLGGRARTVEKDGFTFNLGAHALYQAGAGTPVLRSLGIRPEGVAPPLERYQVSLGGRLDVLPAGPGSLLRSRLLGVRGKAKIGAFLARVPKLDAAALAGRSLREELADRGLDEGAVGALVQAVFRIGTYSSRFDDLDAGAAVGQLQTSLAAGVHYLHGGWGPLLAALAAKVEVRDHVAVRSIEPGAGRVEVDTTAGRFVAGTVVLATGTPQSCRALLPAGAAPGWDGVGEPVTAACLDLALRRIPDPGWVIGLDEPVYATLQGPPASQAPSGQAVMGVLRYGATEAKADRAMCERQARLAGVADGDVVHDRFLASMVVAGGQPRASQGGLAGRPGPASTGVPGVLVAGDWVGPEGLLADAALASGAAAARLALRGAPATAAA